MLGRTVGALAALSLGANAILLPPGVSKISDSRSGALGLALDPKSQAVKVHCSGCAFPSPQQESVQEKGDDDIVWIQGGSKDVVFNFTIDDNDKDLLLNGVKVYPVDGTFTFDQPTVGQIHSSASLSYIKNNPEQITPLRVSQSGMRVHEESVSSLNDVLVSINYQVGELESQPMAIDAVDLKLLKGADGSLMIISVDAAPPKHSVGTTPLSGVPSKDCGMLPAALCKWKSAVEDKISDFKPSMPHAFGGCGGRKPPHKLPGHIRPHFEMHSDGSNAGDRPDRHHPHGPGSHPRPHHGPHGPHHRPHHHRHHHFLPAFVHAFVAVLIPVMAGVTMGMVVSLIGMLVGRLISSLWIKFGRGGQRGYASVSQSEQDTESVEKGIVVVESNVHEEPLPKYEDAPAYDEKDHE
ncbi:hypothetical protein E4T49_01334 [Aureobasidium sp. EXF-10728]|nr:hypothetical protein E4T49_01334 [Aureobasidium sp. EXF-10728]